MAKKTKTSKKSSSLGTNSSANSKMSAKKGKVSKEDEEAMAAAKTLELKQIKTNYANYCKKYITEPLPLIAKRIEKAVQGLEDIDKVRNYCV